MSHGCSDRAQIQTGARSATPSKNELTFGPVHPTPSKTTALPAAPSALPQALLPLQEFQPRRVEPELLFEALADFPQVRRPRRHQQREPLAKLLYQCRLPYPGRAKDENVLPLRVQLAQPRHFFLAGHEGKRHEPLGPASPLARFSRLIFGLP